MGLVNSLVNQIGREIGRDLYRGLKSKPVSADRFSEPDLSFNEQFLADVRSFELAGYDKVTVRHLINLVERSEQVNFRSFDFQDCFRELDDKIDLCREHLDAEFAEKLESLDRKNAENFNAALKQHRAHIESLISKFRAEVKRFDQFGFGLLFLLAFVGGIPPAFSLGAGKITKHLLSVIFGLLLVTGGFLLYNDPGLQTSYNAAKYPEDHRTVISQAIALLVFGLLFYGVSVIKALQYLFERKGLKDDMEDTIISLENYLEKLGRV